MRRGRLDYMTDALYSGQRFRALTILDEGNREGLAIEVATSHSESARRPCPRGSRRRCTGGRARCASTTARNSPRSPFVDWCEAHGVALHYIQPGKPDQNAYIERFNRSYRTEVLDAYVFESIAEVARSHRHLAARATTASGPTTASAGCRRSRFCRGRFRRDSLTSDC